MSLTDAQYAAFIDRLINCREAEDAAKAATKQVYAELADAGEDKTVAGIVVRQQRMTAKDRVKADMRDAAAEDGQSRYLRGKASHVRAREGRSPDHVPDVGNMVDHDPETGEVNEPDAAMRPQTVAAVGPFSSNAGVGAVASPATNSLSSAALPRKTEDRSVVAALHSSAPVTHSNPVTAPAPQVTVDAGRESASDPSALPVVRHDHSKPHPDCQDPEDCGLASWTHMCGGCLRARAAKEASVALQ